MSQMNVPSGMEFQPYKNSQQQTDRLSAQERENVAEQLMDRTAIGRDYVDDIIQTVGDMIPDLAEDRRYHFIERLFQFIHEANGYHGEKTYSFLTTDLLFKISEYERHKVLNALFQGLSRNHVLACEARLAAIATVMAVTTKGDRHEKLPELLKIAQDASWHEAVEKNLFRLIGSMEPLQRTDFVYDLASTFKRNVSKETKTCVMHIVIKALAMVPDQDRALIADAVAPMIFDMDLSMVHKALQFFAENTVLLPLNQRYPYALMLAGLLHDVAIVEDVTEALQSLMPSLVDPSEREHVETLLSDELANTSRRQAQVDLGFEPVPLLQMMDG